MQRKYRYVDLANVPRQCGNGHLGSRRASLCPGHALISERVEEPDLVAQVRAWYAQR
jgi:hypothetical protein